jgi:menaquinol-cytochrome c reductase iron-sulfur subunit
MSFRHNRVDGWKIISEKSTGWVVKAVANHIAVFSPQCTHLGCGYRWDDSKNGIPLPVPFLAFWDRWKG